MLNGIMRVLSELSWILNLGIAILVIRLFKEMTNTLKNCVLSIDRLTNVFRQEVTRTDRHEMHLDTQDVRIGNVERQVVDIDSRLKEIENDRIELG